MNSSLKYRGRFAPSPSGPLHFGSLVSALCSFMQARSKQGEWLVRIEDIDPPREIAGASSLILKALDLYGLHWDGEVLYQSQRLSIYQQQLHYLTDSGLTFCCDCTRAMIKQSGGIYSGSCLNKNLSHSAQTSIRFKPKTLINQFHDNLLGQVNLSSNQIEQYFILKRKDGLFAYQLAVVIDDCHQQITEVVRGVDLLDSTPKQIQLMQGFGAQPPDYFHHPLVVDDTALKLSKQNKAEAIDLINPTTTLIQALTFLGQQLPPDADNCTVSELIQWAITHWNSDLIEAQPATH